MDRSIEPNLEEKIKARKAIVPYLYDLFKGLDKVEISDNRKTINAINIPEIKKALTDAIATIKFPNSQKIKGEVEITNLKEIQKVEVLNQVNIPEVTFPELQKIIGEVKAVNLPTGTDVEANSKTANPSNYLIVRLSDGQKFIDGIGGATSAPMGRSTENIYLREEYTYTTYSGTSLPIMVKKWTDTMVLTETFEYEGFNPVRKFRSIEPYNA